MTELALSIDGSRGRRAGLEDALRNAIRSGQLRSGAALPPSRQLAADFGFARTTVVAVYEQLVAEGYLIARQGSGTTVAALPVRSAPDPVSTISTKPWLLDFLPGEPDHSSFPRRSWLRASRSVLASAPDDLFAYGDTRGLPVLCEALAEYVGRTRAVAADSAQVCIFGGMVSAFGFVAEALLRMGVRCVAVEDPSLPPLRRVLEHAGLGVVSVPVDKDGLDVDHLRRTGAGAVFVTPSHQYPLGVTMTAARRSALVEWARSASTWVVEDDYDGEFRYDRQPLGSLQGLDPSRVLYAGTASKSLAAGLRIAWLVVPPGLTDAVKQARGRRGGVSNLEQATLAEFITSRKLERHVREMRVVYRRRRDALIEMLDQEAPWIDPTGISAGLHFTGLLRDGGPTEAQVIERAGAHSIALFGLADHLRAAPGSEGPLGSQHGALVVGYSRSSAHSFSGSVERLRAFVRTFA